MLSSLDMSTIARKRYPSDLTDLQWDNIEHLFPQGDGSTGRPRTYPVREIVNAVLYLARSGCAWRMLPHDFPPWKTVSYYLYTWRDQGVWEQFLASLRMSIRTFDDRELTPSAGIIDSQTAYLHLPASGIVGEKGCRFRDRGAYYAEDQSSLLQLGRF
jgi:transposase